MAAFEGPIFAPDRHLAVILPDMGRMTARMALTRKNALFAGHDDGAENWAIVASLIEACKLNDVEPQAYLADVLVRLVNLWPNNRLDGLLPWTWAAARPQQQRAAA